MINVFLWLLYFIPALAIELMCYVLAPFVAMFTTSAYRQDYVKRKRVTTLMKRDYLIRPLYWFQTHDNAVDEWWYGVYNTDHWFEFASKWTQADYNNSRFIRYYCRVMWLWRNCAYGFLYTYFSAPIEKGKVYEKGTEKSWWYKLQVFPSSFQLEVNIPLVKWYYSINIGWKAHKEIPRKMYANRIISFRTIR